MRRWEQDRYGQIQTSRHDDAELVLSAALVHGNVYGYRPGDSYPSVGLALPFGVKRQKWIAQAWLYWEVYHDS